MYYFKLLNMYKFAHDRKTLSLYAHHPKLGVEVKFIFHTGHQTKLNLFFHLRVQRREYIEVTVLC
jgi:hypothetical protein